MLNIFPGGKYLKCSWASSKTT